MNYVDNEVYKIMWTDSGTWHENKWETREDFLEDQTNRLSVVCTIGQFFLEDDEKVILGLSRNTKDDSYYGLQFISKASIKSVERY